MALSFLRLFLYLAMLLNAAPLKAAAPPPQSGITLHATRVIYPESAKKGVTLSLTNNNEHAYLMQSWIRPLDLSSGQVAAEVQGADDPTNTIPFIATPPLKRVNAGEKMTLLIRQTRNDLPNDRESVFAVSVKAIPSMPAKTEQTGNQLVIALVNNFKLFYRPAGLPAGGITQAANELHFSRQGDRLIVDNPTPFYLTFSHLTVGGSAVEPAELRLMVPPKGQQHYRLPKAANGDVQWQLLDENTEATPMQRQPL